MKVRALVLLLVLVGQTGAVYGYVDNVRRWEEDRVEWALDAESFEKIGLSSDEARYWVAYALSQWKHRSGADFTTEYLGSEDGCNTIGIAVKEGCHPTLGCQVGAVTSTLYDEAGEIYVGSMCIYAESARYETRIDRVNSETTDLVGLLVHEMGHYIGITSITEDGVGHYPYTAMHPEIAPGLTELRYIYGEDIEGVRAKYGTKTFRRSWRKWEAGQWSSEYSIGDLKLSWQRTDGDVGGSSEVQDDFIIVSSELKPGGTKLRFSQAIYPPVANSGAWVHHDLEYESWTTPAVASNGRLEEEAEWVAVWLPKREDWSGPAPRLRGAVSSDGFASHQFFEEGPGTSSRYKPAIAYAPWGIEAARYFVLHVGLTGEISFNSFTSDGGFDPALYPVDTGLYSLDSPDIDCSVGGYCTVTFVDATYSMPRVVAVRAEMLDDPPYLDLNVGSPRTETDDIVQHTPSIGNFTSPNAPGYSLDWLMTWNYPGAFTSYMSEGKAHIYFLEEDVSPPTQGLWTATRDIRHHPPAVASHRYREQVILLQTEY